jgi:cell division protein FtsQ
MWVIAGVAGAWIAYDAGHFLLASPQMELIHPDQVSLSGNHYVAPASVRELFAADRGKSVLRIPLDERRRAIETLPWVEQATVRRALPNKIQVDITERTPVAFVRESSELALVDAHGVILDRPVEGDFHFPVVTGLDASMPLADREERMQLFSGFTQQIESARAGAMEQVSEVDLSAEHDVRAALTGFERGDADGVSSDAPVLVHFGDSDFAGKYQTLVEEFGQWHAKAGRIESVDLRFSREAVVNQDTTAIAQRVPKLVAAHAAKHSR